MAAKLAERYAKLATQARLPPSATLELLSPCNLKCVHCYVTHEKPNRLTLPVIESIFEQLAAAGTFTLTLTGGEIALRKDFFEILEMARHKHFNVKLLTSGTRFGPKEWDRIADLAIAHTQLSVYGMSDAVHDAVTQIPGSLKKTLATAFGLKERGVDVAFACPVMNINVHEVPALIAWSKSIDIQTTLDPNISITDQGDSFPKDTLASFDALVDLYGSKEVARELNIVDPCGTVDGDLRTCGVGRGGMFIQSTGDVLPCSNWPKPAGNVLRQSLLDIFRNSSEMNFARAITVADQTGCSSCSLQTGCNRCVGLNLQDSQSVAIPAQAVCTSTKAIHAASPRRRALRILAN